MEKPITLIREDFIKSMARTINTSKLPAFVIEPILANLLDEVRAAAVKQYESDKAKYEQEIANEEANNDRNRLSERIEENTD